MHILIACDSFKETLSAPHVCDIIARSMKKELPSATYTTMPLADGGEGTAQILTRALGGTMHKVSVEAADGRMRNAHFGIDPQQNIAFVDCASAIGLEHIAREKRNPLHTSSYGLGQILKAAHKCGVSTIVVGLGGSATVDGGIGMAQALGIRMRNAQRVDLVRGGKALHEVATIDTSGAYRFENCRIIVAVDVQNPLIGDNGAARVFGPQKGADEKTVALLEKGMQHYARITHRTCTKTQCFDECINFAGAGAAGGLGMALSVFCGAQIQSGIETVLKHCQFDRYIADADFVITGEGKLDGQSLYGKVPYGVLHKAKQHGVPVIMLCGSVDDSAVSLYEKGVCAIFSCTLKSSTWEETRAHAHTRLAFTARSLARFIHAIGTATYKL